MGSALARRRPFSVRAPWAGRPAVRCRKECRKAAEPGTVAHGRGTGRHRLPGLAFQHNNPPRAPGGLVRPASDACPSGAQPAAAPARRAQAPLAGSSLAVQESRTRLPVDAPCPACAPRGAPVQDPRPDATAPRAKDMVYLFLPPVLTAGRAGGRAARRPGGGRLVQSRCQAPY